MRKPIKQDHLETFLSFMDEYDAQIDLPDGAWLAYMEEVASDYMEGNEIKGDPDDAMFQWIKARSTKAIQ